MDNQRFEQADREQNGFIKYNDANTFEFDGGRFPRELERRWVDLIDRRYALFLFVSFIFHFTTALYFVYNPPGDEISSKDIEKIQNQYVELIFKAYEKEIEEEEHKKIVLSEAIIEKEMSEGTKSENKETGGSDQTATTGEIKGVTAAAQVTKHDVGMESPGNTKKHISKEVSSKGLLGILSGSSEATGEGVADLLGEGDEGSLENVFNQLEGIKVANSGSKGARDSGSSSKGSHTVKGSRTTSGGGIDNLISGRGTAKSTNIKREESIVVSSISAVTNEEGLKSDSRNPDEVSEVVIKHNNAIHYCYQRELKRNPALKGKLVVRFTIAPNGKVNKVTIISSTLNNQRVERCVVSRIRRWDEFGAIDPVKGDAVFRQVYTFGY